MKHFCFPDNSGISGKYKYDQCICCQEVGPASEKKDDAHLQCITDHEGFIGNCLNRHVIEVSLYAFVKRDGPIDDNEPINE
jgi:hypothetical protein